jgi:hypothetical protein
MKRLAGIVEFPPFILGCEGAIFPRKSEYFMLFNVVQPAKGMLIGQRVKLADRGFIGRFRRRK